MNPIIRRESFSETTFPWEVAAPDANDDLHALSLSSCIAPHGAKMRHAIGYSLASKQEQP